MVRWEALGAVDPECLVDARLQLHWAVQAAAAPGKLLAPARPDFSQQSLSWDSCANVLAQEAHPGSRPWRSALRLAPPTLALLARDGETLAAAPLHGRTVEEAHDWLECEVAALLGRPLPSRFERPGGLPHHPVGEGSPFHTADCEAFVELARYFADADLLLSAVRAANPEATEVRCWPHHFDLATLLRLDGDEAGESGRTIGVGFSPGDTTRPAPYFYVTPWPYPLPPAGGAPLDLPELDGGGSWNREGWLGAVLEAARFVGAGSNGAQRRQIERFLESAIAACRSLLAGGAGVVGAAGVAG